MGLARPAHERQGAVDSAVSMLCASVAGEPKGYGLNYATTGRGRARGDMMSLAPSDFMLSGGCQFPKPALATSQNLDFPKDGHTLGKTVNCSLPRHAGGWTDGCHPGQTLPRLGRWMSPGQTLPRHARADQWVSPGQTLPRHTGASWWVSPGQTLPRHSHGGWRWVSPGPAAAHIAGVDPAAARGDSTGWVSPGQTLPRHTGLAGRNNV